MSDKVSNIRLRKKFVRRIKIMIFYIFFFVFLLAMTSVLATVSFSLCLFVCMMLFASFFMFCFRERMLSLIPFFLAFSFDICFCFVRFGSQFPFLFFLYRFFFSYTFIAHWSFSLPLADGVQIISQRELTVFDLVLWLL